MDTVGRVIDEIGRRGEAAVGELADLDLSRPALFRALAELVAQGRIVRVRRGVYQRAEVRDAGDSWVQALQRYPQGVLCLLSALAFHELSTQSPSVVWLALPKPKTRSHDLITSYLV